METKTTRSVVTPNGIHLEITVPPGVMDTKEQLEKLCIGFETQLFKPAEKQWESKLRMRLIQIGIRELSLYGWQREVDKARNKNKKKKLAKWESALRNAEQELAKLTDSLILWLKQNPYPHHHFLEKEDSEKSNSEPRYILNILRPNIF